MPVAHAKLQLVFAVCLPAGFVVISKEQEAVLNSFFDFNEFIQPSSQAA